MQFIDLMNSGKGPVCAWEEDFREHNPINGPYFKTGDLASEFFTVNVLDWLAWQKARGGGSECIPSDAALAAKKSPHEGSVRGMQLLYRINRANNAAAALSDCGMSPAIHVPRGTY